MRHVREDTHTDGTSDVGAVVEGLVPLFMQPPHDHAI
jgi:hypothetical protein